MTARTSCRCAIDEAVAAARAERDAIIREHAGEGFRAPAVRGYYEVTVTRSSKRPGAWQVTLWNGDGRPDPDDIQCDSYEAAVLAAQWDAGADLARAGEWTRDAATARQESER